MCEECTDVKATYLLAMRAAFGEKEFAEFADRTRAWLMNGDLAAEYAVSQSDVDTALRDFNECHNRAMRADLSKVDIDLLIVDRND